MESLLRISDDDDGLVAEHVIWWDARLGELVTEESLVVEYPAVTLDEINLYVQSLPGSR